MMRYIKNKYVIVAVVIVVIAILYLIMRGGSSAAIESSPVTLGNVVEKVSVTGKISPSNKADLSFDVSGSISHIYVKVGDQVKKGDVLASLGNADAIASLASAQAKLDDIKRVLRPEELRVEQAKVDSARVALQNAKTNAVNASRNGYVQAQGAIVNYADIFFLNPQSSNPIIKINTQSGTRETVIEQERVVAGDQLKKWKNDLDNASSTDDVGLLLANSNGYLSNLKSFADDLSSIVNGLNPGNSGLPQLAIDSYVATINTCLSTLNQSITSVSGAETSLEQAQTTYSEASSNFTLKTSGSSAETIRSQQAAVDSLMAVVAKGSIRSPLDGVVTRVDPHEGEYAAPGISGFSVQSDGAYKIEAYVPEADIAKVAVGNHADVTLDAYGSDTIFAATVTLMDPAETVLEGVPTYKVTLGFNQKDARIRSGMTANTDILTHEHNGVLYVPTRAIIINSDGTRSVRVLNKDGKTFVSVPVTIGLKSSNGTTEIATGLAEGQKAVTYTK